MEAVDVANNNYQGFEAFVVEMPRHEETARSPHMRAVLGISNGLLKPAAQPGRVSLSGLVTRKVESTCESTSV